MQSLFHHRRWRIVLCLGVLVSVQACGCDLVGCTDGLRVQLPAQLNAPYRVELLVAGERQLAPPEATCTDAAPCYHDIMFRTTPTERVVVRVTTPLGVRDTAIPRIKYSTSHPNGSRCEPTCRGATIRAEIPL